MVKQAPTNHSQTKPASQPQSAPEDLLPPTPTQPEPEIPYLTWEAANRPFKKRDKEFYTTIGVITFLVSLILFFAGQFLPIAVVIATAFLAYVLASVPPEKQTNSITNYGIRLDDKLYFWTEMGRFWFSTKFKQPLLHIEISRFPGQLTILLGKHSQEELKQILMNFLIMEKPPNTYFDQAANWLQKKIPLSND